MFTHTWRVAIFVATMILSGCQPSSPEPQFVDKPCPQTAARVAVMSSGAIVLNGKVVDLDTLSTELRHSDPAFTLACYYRENPSAAEPHPIVFKVLDAIVTAKLPISLYLDADFQNIALVK